MLVRVVVDNHAFARVRRQVEVLLERKLISLVHKYPVARATLCRFRVVETCELQNARPPAGGIVTLALYLARGFVNVEKLPESAPAPQYVLAVLIRAAASLLVGHTGHQDYVPVVVRV